MSSSPVYHRPEQMEFKLTKGTTVTEGQDPLATLFEVPDDTKTIGSEEGNVEPTHKADEDTTAVHDYTAGIQGVKDKLTELLDAFNGYEDLQRAADVVRTQSDAASREKIAHLENENARLQDEIGAVESLREHNQRLIEQLQQAEREKEEHLRDKDVLESQHREELSRLQDKNAQLQETIDELSSLREHNQRLIEQVRQGEHDKEQAAQEKDETERAHRAEIARYENSIAELQETIDGFEPMKQEQVRLKEEIHKAETARTDAEVKAEAEARRAEEAVKRAEESTIAAMEMSERAEEEARRAAEAVAKAEAETLAAAEAVARSAEEVALANSRITTPPTYAGASYNSAKNGDAEGAALAQWAADLRILIPRLGDHNLELLSRIDKAAKKGGYGNFLESPRAIVERMRIQAAEVFAEIGQPMPELESTTHIAEVTGPLPTAATAAHEPEDLKEEARRLMNRASEAYRFDKLAARRDARRADLVALDAVLFSSAYKANDRSLVSVSMRRKVAAALLADLEYTKGDADLTMEIAMVREGLRSVVEAHERTALEEAFAPIPNFNG